MKTTLKTILAGLVLAIASGPALAAPASENWENLCASCHGEDGKAQTKSGKKLKIRDYSDPKVQAELKDDDMLKAIADGVKVDGKEKMKAYKDEISADEIKELVAFIRKLKP
jgi:cytochrome c6